MRDPVVPPLAGASRSFRPILWALHTYAVVGLSCWEAWALTACSQSQKWLCSRTSRDCHVTCTFPGIRWRECGCEFYSEIRSMWGFSSGFPRLCEEDNVKRERMPVSSTSRCFPITLDPRVELVYEVDRMRARSVTRIDVFLRLFRKARFFGGELLLLSQVFLFSLPPLSKLQPINMYFLVKNLGEKASRCRFS